MKRRFILVAVLCAASIWAPSAEAATGLKIQPLEYDAALTRGEVKRGIVDVSNPSDASIQVSFSVQAARAVNDAGELEFYDDEAITAGVKLDQTRIELGPKRAYRLIFELDSSKLPEGDSVAALFAQTTGEGGAVRSSARVGTILFIANGTPTARNAAITSLTTDWIHTNREVRGSYRITNRAETEGATGYRPRVTIQLSPLHEAVTTTGPLVFTGQERRVQFALPSTAVGIYKLSVKTEASEQAKWVVLLPAWSALVAVGLVLSLSTFGWIRRRKTAARRKSSHSA